MLRKPDFPNAVVILAATGLVTWFCFTAVLAGILRTWLGGLIVSSMVGLAFLHVHRVRRRIRRARDELRRILGPSSDPPDDHQVYGVLRPLRHYDRRIQHLLDCTDSYALGVLSRSEYRDEVLTTMDDIVG